MARAQVEVVAVDDVRSVAGQSILREVSSLWMTQRVDQGMSPEAATRAAADGRLREALGRADVRAWVARVDGTAVGYAITSENPFGLSTQPEVAIDQIFVDRRARRHGVARALLTTVVAHAERRGSEVIVSNVPAQSREANRFFARWGFSSVVVRRVVSTSVLRRRLTPGARPELLDAIRRRRHTAAPALQHESA
jgi:GNAT superfamily N-acetyltransferase